jgi:hypothetical protein
MARPQLERWTGNKYRDEALGCVGRGPESPQILPRSRPIAPPFWRGFLLERWPSPPNLTRRLGSIENDGGGPRWKSGAGFSPPVLRLDTHQRPHEARGAINHRWEVRYFLVMENGLNVTFPAPAPLIWDPVAVETATLGYGIGIGPPGRGILLPPASAGDATVINAATASAALNI